MIESAEFIAWLGGKNEDELSQLLTSEGDALVARPDFLPEDTEMLAVTAIRSAIKTILVTRFVWGDTIDQHTG